MKKLIIIVFHFFHYYVNYFEDYFDVVFLVGLDFVPEVNLVDMVDFCFGKNVEKLKDLQLKDLQVQVGVPHYCLHLECGQLDGF